MLTWSVHSISLLPVPFFSDRCPEGVHCSRASYPLEVITTCRSSYNDPVFAVKCITATTPELTPKFVSMLEGRLTKLVERGVNLVV